MTVNKKLFNTVFIFVIIISALAILGGLIPLMAGFMIFGPDLGEVKHCSNADNYTHIQGKIIEYDISENSIYSLKISSPQTKFDFEYRFSDENQQTVIQNGFLQVIAEDLSVEIITINTPGPMGDHIASLSCNGTDYLTFEQGQASIVKEYSDIEKSAKIWLFTSGGVMIAGISALTLMLVLKFKVVNPARKKERR